MSNNVIYANNVNNNNSLNVLNTKAMNVNVKNTTTMYSSTIGGTVKMLNYKNIAPAPAPSTQNSEFKCVATIPATDAIDVGVKTRKYAPRVTSTPPYSVDQTQSVQRRNARERNRVKQVNNSFARLRQHLPQYIVSDMTKGGGRGPHKKISKVDTLRIAVEYIRRLEYLVEDLGGSDCLGVSNESAATGAADVTASSATSSIQSQVYYTNANGSQVEFQQQTLPPVQQLSQHHINFPSSLLTPVSLGAFSPTTTLQTKVDISCHSPTSSYISNTSFDSGTYEPTQQLSPEPYGDAAGDHLAAANNANLALKFEPYENFRLDEEDCTPDDDDIIDYISLWQEEQQASQN